jgi:5-dehydro-2-deoxygluconokinase
LTHDLITVGRANMDLYSQDIGADFEDVTGFDAMVGGSPTNIAIGVSRLGLQVIAFSGVGDDRVGDFVVRYLRDEGVDTSHVVRKPGKLTSLALLGVQPPDHFPLSFYREDPADIHLTVDDAARLPFGETRAVMLSGNAYSRGSCIEAATYCAEQARSADMMVIVDLDLRPSEWLEPTGYGRALRPIIPLTDVVLGTEEEFYAAMSPTPESVTRGAKLTTEALSEVDELILAAIESGVLQTVAIKRGKKGVTVIDQGSRLEVEGFDVAVVNTVGAGDAFASGLIYGRLQGWEWQVAARFANACGAIVVSRHGCSSAFPTLAEVYRFLDDRGGL